MAVDRSAELARRVRPYLESRLAADRIRIAGGTRAEIDQAGALAWESALCQLGPSAADAPTPEMWQRGTDEL